MADDHRDHEGLVGFLHEHPLLSLAGAWLLGKALEKPVHEPPREIPPDLDPFDEMAVWAFLNSR